MGGDLSSSDDPAFLVLANRDPGTPESPGGLLQRIQIVKGWVDDDGELNEKVYDVAGGPNGADVDLANCTPRGDGHDRLCSVWRDPEFSPDHAAVYYARVVENPSCRWNSWVCMRAGVDCEGGDVPDGLASCCDESIPRTIQERAWTSPIWYTP